MTCREKLKIEHPDRIKNGCIGGCVGCPSGYKYLDVPDYCGDVNIPAKERCAMCWDREIPDTDNKSEENKEERTIEIVYTDGTHDLLYGVKNFELKRDTRVFKIQQVDSDICTFIPAEHVIRIGKVWEDVD